MNSKTSLVRYRRTKFFIALGFVGYVAAGLVTDRLPEGELYPFLSWQFFSDIPNRLPMYEVRILGVGPTSLKEPVWYRDDDGTYTKKTVDPSVYALILLFFGRALEEQSNQSIIPKYQRLLEETFRYPDTRYEIVKFEYDPVMFITKSEVRETVSVATLTAGQE